MSESPSRSPESAETDRRHRSNRRAGGGESRRGARASQPWERRARIVLRDAGMILGTLAAIIVGVKVTNPIYTNQPSVVASLEKKAPIVKAVLDTMAPITDTTRSQIVSTPQFEQDR